MKYVLRFCFVLYVDICDSILFPLNYVCAFAKKSVDNIFLSIYNISLLFYWHMYVYIYIYIYIYIYTPFFLYSTDKYIYMCVYVCVYV